MTFQQMFQWNAFWNERIFVEEKKSRTNVKETFDQFSFSLSIQWFEFFIENWLSWRSLGNIRLRHCLVEDKREMFYFSRQSTRINYSTDPHQNRYQISSFSFLSNFIYECEKFSLALIVAQRNDFFTNFRLTDCFTSGSRSGQLTFNRSSVSYCIRLDGRKRELYLIFWTFISLSSRSDPSIDRNCFAHFLFERFLIRMSKEKVFFFKRKRIRSFFIHEIDSFVKKKRRTKGISFFLISIFPFGFRNSEARILLKRETGFFE